MDREECYCFPSKSQIKDFYLKEMSDFPELANATLTTILSFPNPYYIPTPLNIATNAYQEYMRKVIKNGDKTATFSAYISKAYFERKIIDIVKKIPHSCECTNDNNWTKYWWK